MLAKRYTDGCFDSWTRVRAHELWVVLTARNFGTSTQRHRHRRYRFDPSNWNPRGFVAPFCFGFFCIENGQCAISATIPLVIKCHIDGIMNDTLVTHSQVLWTSFSENFVPLRSWCQLCSIIHRGKKNRDVVHKIGRSHSWHAYSGNSTADRDDTLYPFAVDFDKVVDALFPST